jgi:hypothetical protein
MRIRMFCDWDNNSRQLIDRLKQQTNGFNGDQFGSATFVDDDSYTHAVAFNYPVYDIKSPPENNIALLLEPPPISEMMHGESRRKQFDNVKAIYSFVEDPPCETEYGLGFATVPKGQYPPWFAKEKKICMIVSSKVLTQYHVRRHEIKEALLQSDVDIDFYGRGLVGDDPRIKGEIAPMAKYSILSQYKFCIDFENWPNAITDKYFDPILCNTIPVSNSPILQDFKDSLYYYVDFNWDLDTIVDRIRHISHDKEASLITSNRVFERAQKQIMEGNMSLAHWIIEKVSR